MGLLFFMTISNLFSLNANRLYNHVVVPGTSVTMHASSETFTRAISSKKIWKVIWFYNLQELFLIFASTYFDFVSGPLIKEAFDDSPHSGEEEGSVHDKHLPHNLRIVVLSYLTG